MSILAFVNLSAVALALGCTACGTTHERPTEGAGSDAARPPSEVPLPFDAGSGDASARDASARDGAAPDAAASDTVSPDAAALSENDAAAEAGVADGGSPTGADAVPSAGCGKAGRPASGRAGVQGSHNYTFPASYDGSRPFPLLLGFHAASNPIEQIENLTRGSELESGFIRAFPKSKGSAWSYDADITHVLAMYDDLLAHYCVDTRRVFATGHSSGAQLIVQLLTPAHRADAEHLALRAVAPVAASRYGAVSRAIPVLYIQGAHDSERRSDGADVVREFAAANGCASTTRAFAGPTCTSSGKQVSDGCVRYDGCRAPTAWCSHDDPAYSGTNHGWPCFATAAMHAFFTALPSGGP